MAKDPKERKGIDQDVKLPLRFLLPLALLLFSLGFLFGIGIANGNIF